MSGPCKDCKDRIVGKDRAADCHSDCVKYKEYLEEYYKHKKQRQLEQSIDQMDLESKMVSLRKRGVKKFER